MALVQKRRVVCSPQILPAGEELEGRGAEELVRQVIDFFHDVGQSDRKLLSQEHKGGFLTGIGRACRHRTEKEEKTLSKHITLTLFCQRIKTRPFPASVFILD